MLRRLWPGRGSLRVRLTAWYVLLLGLTMALFSGYLYLRTEHNLLAQVDAGLQVAASQALATVDEENGHTAFQNTENAQAVARQMSQAGFAARLIAPDGTVWHNLGDAAPLPIRAPWTAGYVTLDGGGDQWRVYSQPIRTPDGHVLGWLQTAQSLELVREMLGNLRTQILLGLPLVLLVAGLSGLFLADRALRPISRITRTAQSISASDLMRRIGYQGPADEVGRLAATLDRMLDRLQAAFERERRFTADASHELRTPLTALKGRIGVTLSRPRTPVEYQSTLEDLETEVDRLSRLSTDLLLLARLDRGHLPWQPALLDLAELLAAIVEQIKPLAEAKGLTLVEEVPRGLLLCAEHDYLLRLFLNLLDNAIKHTPRGGRVTVRAEADDTQVHVVVWDTGPGISPEHFVHLFDRFYRTEAARSRDTGGAGLGLAIAYEIARWHGGTLQVESEPGMGATFKVHLPVRPPAAGLDA
jgi:heavy metal sensor kinase